MIVTSGSQHALDLAARAVLEPGDAVWMEDPGCFGAGGAFVSAGAHLVPVPVDGDRMNVGEGIRRHARAKLAFVTPVRQLPLGVTMTLERRLALLGWAAQRRAWILEDDYDSEVPLPTRPLGVAAGPRHLELRHLHRHRSARCDASGAAARYLVVPDSLVDAVTVVRRHTDFCAPYFSQAVMADFMREGHFDATSAGCGRSTRLAASCSVDLLRRDCAGLLEVEAPDAGMNLIAWLPIGTSDRKISAALRTGGIDDAAALLLRDETAAAAGTAARGSAASARPTSAKAPLPPGARQLERMIRRRPRR